MVIDLITQCQVTSVCVTEVNGHPLGTLTDFDILKAIEFRGGMIPATSDITTASLAA